MDTIAMSTIAEWRAKEGQLEAVHSDYFKQIPVGQIVSLLEARTVNQVRELDLSDFVSGK